MRRSRAGAAGRAAWPPRARPGRPAGRRDPARRSGAPTPRRGRCPRPPRAPSVASRMSRVTPPVPDRIAYGLRVGGLPDDAPLLAHPPGPRWPDLRLAHEPANAAGPANAVATTVPLRGGGELRLEGGAATFVTSDPPTPDALVHPHLAAAAAGRNRLLGRDV